MPRDLKKERARRDKFFDEYGIEHISPVKQEVQASSSPVKQEVQARLSPQRALVGERILVNLHNKETDVEHPHIGTIVDITNKIPGRTRRHLVRFEDGYQEWLKLKRPYNKSGLRYYLLDKKLGRGKHLGTQRKRRRRRGTRKPRRQRHHGKKKHRRSTKHLG